MNHLDRYLGAYPCPVDKNLFQLLAMTCLYLSIKLNVYKHLLIHGSTSSMDSILQLSKGYFTLAQMEKMEHDVLQRLQWHVHPPTPQTFVKHFLFFLSVEEHEVHDLAQFIVELSVMDYFFVSYKPSEIAVAGVLIAFDRLLPNRQAQANFPFNRTLIEIDTPQVKACQSRLMLRFAQASEQASNMEDAPHAVTCNRTTSPVSVMAHPNDPAYKFRATETMDTE
jgi:Cyclin, C-terminal domain/Cyclin, N-terminal domain